MDTDDVVWLIAFLILLFAINFVNYLGILSLKEKPLGQQSLFDSLSQVSFTTVEAT
jgi:hypothetical protein